MKVIILYVLLMALPQLVLSQLNPDFNADVTNACKNALIHFQDASASTNSIQSWSWTVNGSPFSTQANPTYYFSHAGDYEICLTIEDNAGDVQTICKTDYIQIHNPPIASFTSDRQWACGLPSIINFMDQSSPTDTNLVRWIWDYGDGILDSTAQSPTHGYSITGIFDVTLIVRDANGCSNSALLSDLIHINNVTANIQSNQTDTICQLPVSVNFGAANPRGSGTISYLWNFGNGNTANTQTALAFYDSAGSYPIQLILQDSFCTDTIHSPAGVSANIINADFALDTTWGCYELTTSVQNLPNNLIIHEFWDFDYDNNFATNVPNASCYYDDPGLYQIMHTLEDIYGCKDTVWHKVEVAEPAAEIGLNRISGCTPLVINFADSSYSRYAAVSITQWDWELTPTNTSSAQHPSMIYSDTGEYLIQLTVTDAFGCTDFADTLVRAGIHSQINSWSRTPDNICHPYENIIFTMDGSPYIDTIMWALEDTADTPCLLVSSPTEDIICPGVFDNNLLIVSHNGCRDTLELLDTFVVHKAIAAFSYTCGSLTVDFEADTTRSTEWYWDFGDSSTTADLDTGIYVSYTYPSYGKYTVSLIVYDSVTGCRDTLDREISVLESFNSTILSEDTICLGEVLYLRDTNSLAELRQWWSSNPSDTFLYESLDTLGTAIGFLEDYGLHSIFVRAQTFAGCVDTFQKNVFVSQPRPIIHLPDPTRACVPLDKLLYVSDSTNNSNPIVQYEWGSGHSTDTINYTITHATLQNFEITVTNDAGCKGFATLAYEPHWVTAAFTLPDNICVPNSFQLNNISSSSLPNPSYLWTFGDGDSSRIKNPTHHYEQGTVYNVKLYIRNDSLDCLDSLSQFIIANKLVAAWGADSTNANCPPLTTNFTDSSRAFSYSPTGLKWNWYFGDGSASIIEDPSHIYSLPGSYDVTMILSNLVGCTDTLHRDSFILIEGPDGSWQVDDKTGCQPLNAQFSAQSDNTINYTWVFGDGNFQINRPNTATDSINYTYAQVGKYYPILILEDSTGCKVPFTGDTITVRAYPIFTISPDTSICKNEQIPFDLNISNSVGNIQVDWWFEAGLPYHSDSLNPVVQFDSAGLFDLTIAIDMESCADTILYADFVTVHAPPIANFAASNTDSCVGFSSQFTDLSNPVEGSLQSWKWNFGNGQFSNIQQPLSTFYNTVDSFEAKLIVSNTFGCTDSVAQTIYSRPFPLAIIQADTSICVQDTLVLNGQGGQTYSWSSTNSINNHNLAETFSIPTHSSQYILQVWNEYNCGDKDTLAVRVHSLPNIDAGLAQTICEGDSLILVATPSNYDNYQWSGNNSCPTCIQTIVSPSTSEQYTVVVQDSNNCYNQDFIEVTVLSTQFTKLNNRSICKEDSIRLSSVAGTVLSWSGTSLSCLQCPNPIAKPIETSTYTLDFELANGCPVQDSLVIKVLDISSFSAGIDQSICIGENAVLNPTLKAGIPFEWKSPAVLVDSSILKATLTTTTTSYAELLVGEDACIQNDFVSIFVHNPLPTTAQDIDACEGDSVQLQVQSQAAQTEWLSTFAFLDTNAIHRSNPTIQAIQTHQYPVVGHHQYCPNDTAYATITVHQSSPVDLGEDLQVLKLQPIQFDAITNGSSIDWQWSPAHLLDCSDCPNPKYIATTDQTFVVQVTDSWGCINSDSIHIGIYPPCYVDLITVPTAFSPNGDGINDQIYPLSIGNKVNAINEFRVYNRWGSLVFASNSLQEGWDGKYKGQKAAIGVYAYYLTYPCPLDGQSVIISGEFTLIR